MASSINLRIQDWKDKDKNPWPEHADKGVVLQEPTMATILERGTVGGQPVVMVSAEQQDGSIFTFQLTQNIWEMISGSLKGAVARWKDAGRERCDGKFTKIENLLAARKMNSVFQKWSKFDADAMEAIFNAAVGAYIYRCDICGSLFAWHDSQGEPHWDKSLHYKRTDDQNPGTEFVPAI